MLNDGVLDPDQNNFPTFATNNASSTPPRLAFNKLSSNILSCTQIRNTFPNSLITYPTINLITVPPKFCKNKVVNNYKSIRYDDIDEELYVFKHFGKILKSSQHFNPRLRSDLVLRDKHID